MKYSVLEITQNILSALNSDEVNSISDSPESMQVATIIKNKYHDIISRGDLPEHNQIFQLTPSNTETEPVLMFIPDGVGRIEWIKYFNSEVSGDTDQGGHGVNVDIVDTDDDSTETTPGYQYVTMLPVKQFVDMVNGFNPDEEQVESFTFSDTSNNFPGDFTFYYRNDRQPKYCTILSNYYVIFDAFDIGVDSTLQASKTFCYGQVVPTFRMEDDFIPDLDSQQFPLLLNEAKSLAFYELKQTPHAKADQEIKRQWSTVQKNKSVALEPSYFNQLPNFGRK